MTDQKHFCTKVHLDDILHQEQLEKKEEQKRKFRWDTNSILSGVMAVLLVVSLVQAVQLSRVKNIVSAQETNAVTKVAPSANAGQQPTAPSSASGTKALPAQVGGC
ncbi:MAG: hypothetical protein Q8Q20_04435 [bacterium]|nr:hypothetical protein [bacterium]